MPNKQGKKLGGRDYRILGLLFAVAVIFLIVMGVLLTMWFLGAATITISFGKHAAGAVLIPGVFPR